MGIYSPGRRRAIALLLLTSILLITIDLRGNQLVDAARRGFNTVLGPFETAGEVVARPIQNAWHGITDYEDVVEENRRLQDELDAQTADIVAAQAALLDNQQLLALNDLPTLASYDRAVAQVVGEGPTNLDQVIEINKGGNDGIEVGMPVLSPAGLVGKVTRVEPQRSEIMLLTDARYAINVKIVPSAPLPPPTTTTVAAATTTTLTPVLAPGETAPTTGVPPTTSTSTTTVAGAAATSTTTTVRPAGTTTTTIDLDVVRETGGLIGQGEGDLPEIAFLDNTPSRGQYEVGDLVFTSGSEDSLAPPNIPIGRVVNVIDQSTSEGPRLQIEPFARLDSLYFVSVVLYVPESEADDRAETERSGD